MNIVSRVCASRAGRVSIGAVAGASLLLGAAAPLVHAASLTPAQIGAITTMLTAFNVDAGTIANVNTILSGGTVATGSTMPSSGAVRGHMIGALKKGDHGRGVCLLQALLAADPAVDAALAASVASSDCPFGPLTENALKNFQRKHGLEAVGFIGPKTLKALERKLDDNPLDVEDDDEDTTTSTNNGARHGRICAKVPPGHLIAPGWLRKHGGEKPVIPECQKIPKGIEDKLKGGDNHGTTTPDTIAPVISSVSVGSIATTSVAVSWVTDESATSNVYYASGSSIDLSTALTKSNASRVTAHSLNLSGLTASTTYQYVVSSSDKAGNTATSSAYSFTTTN